MNSTLTPSTSSRTTASPAVGVAAIGAGAILLGFAGLQVALAAGAPLGERHAWSVAPSVVLLDVPVFSGMRRREEAPPDG
jgi:hypothetical protein